jgi:hypothetical protein
MAEAEDAWGAFGAKAQKELEEKQKREEEEKQVGSRPSGRVGGTRMQAR